MSPSLDNLGWFYRNDQAHPDSSYTPTSILLTSSTIIGFLVLTKFIFSFLRLLTSLFILPGKKLSSFGHPPSTYAIITGASDGLGRDYALQLSAHGFHTLLISRTASKLASVASTIRSKYPNLDVRTHSIDFAHASSSDYAALKDVIDSLTTSNNTEDEKKEIGILINNVGLSHSLPVPFSLTPTAEIESIITVNTLSTLKITQLVLPHLLARRKGLIITMGSFGGLLPTPLLATYSGSKAFLQYWSTALAAEVAPYNITVELVQSYLVTTAMSKIRRSSALIPGPGAFVRSVLGKVGRTGGAQGFSYTSTPYWSHAVMEWGMLKVVGVHGKVALAVNKRMHEGIRKRALRKQEREAGEGKGGGQGGKGSKKE